VFDNVAVNTGTFVAPSTTFLVIANPSVLAIDNPASCNVNLALERAPTSPVVTLFPFAVYSAISKLASQRPSGSSITAFLNAAPAVDLISTSTSIG